MRPGTTSIGFGPPRQRDSTRVDEHEVVPLRDLRRFDCVAAAFTRPERRRLDLFLAGAQLAAPALDPVDEHRAVVVAEVAEQPPEPLGAAHAAVGDDEDAVADARARRCPGEALGRRQRVAALPGSRPVGEVVVDVEERSAGDVPLEVRAAPCSASARSQRQSTNW